jgi:NAD(P)-dependent dehydrogenase (short-subunit alcohol dehydrogenase family)
MPATMTVLITGGTEALGQPVVQAVLQGGHAAVVANRDPNEWASVHRLALATDEVAQEPKIRRWLAPGDTEGKFAAPQ